MKTQYLLSVAFAALCSAQSQAIGALPDCAKPCAATLPANCNFDVKCICADTGYINGISCCVAKACSDSEVQKTIQVAQQLCSTVKVTIPNGVPDSCKADGGSSSEASSSSTTAAGSSGTATSGSSASTASTSSSSSAANAQSATSAATPAASTGGAACPHVGGNLGALGAAIIAAALI